MERDLLPASLQPQPRQEDMKVNTSHEETPANQSKLSRIIQYAPDIKKFYFIDAKHRFSLYILGKITKHNLWILFDNTIEF